MEKKTSLNYSTRLLTEQDIPQMQSLFQSTVFYVNSKDYTTGEFKFYKKAGDADADKETLTI